MPEAKPVKIAILGDSRTFDTYYVNERYVEPYGYDKTFASIWSRAGRLSSQVPCEVIHIPDHFRGGTIENNITRLALCDPDVVVLCDGIWETLLNKQQFIDYAAKKIGSHDVRSEGELILRFSTQSMAELFIQGELNDSPDLYAARITRIASYFVRRNRRVFWMNLCVPGPDHLDRLHYAGNYVCAPEWDQCLSAVNTAVERCLAQIGAGVIDVHRYMEEFGGPSAALLDQWHYTASFHAYLATVLPSYLTQQAVAAVDHEDISHQVMYRCGKWPLKVVLIGAAVSEHFLARHDRLQIVHHAVSVDALSGDLEQFDCILYSGGHADLQRDTPRIKARFGVGAVIVQVDEIDGVDNPMPASRDDGRRAKR